VFPWGESPGLNVRNQRGLIRASETAKIEINMSNDLAVFISVAAALLTLYALFARKRNPDRRSDAASRDKAAKPRPGEGELAEDAVRDIDMDGEFLAKAEGRRMVDAIRLYSQEDCAMLRSMLYSCGIMSLVRFANMNSLRPGAGIPSYNDIVLTLYEDDLGEAREIVDEYNLRGVGEAPTAGEKIRNMAEFLVAGWIVGGPKAGPRADFIAGTGKEE